MTSEEILKMEAGPELDRLVAERVMEWDEGKDFGIGESGIVRYIREGPKYFERTKIEAWAPSTDIKAAWEVMERLAPHFEIKLFNAMEPQRSRGWKDVWVVDIQASQEGAPLHRSIDDNAPLAICRAALLAMMEASDE